MVRFDLLGFGGKSHGSVRWLIPPKLIVLVFLFEIDNSQDTTYRTNLVRFSSMATLPHGFPSEWIELTMSPSS